MKCEDCFYWDNSAQLDDAQPDTTGMCRRHAPKMDVRFGIPPAARWPFTEDVDWCGEYSARNRH